MKLAPWPFFTWPTSASSTLTCSFIFARSSASVNSVTACSDAATALPGSTERESTTPSMGERIVALARFVSLLLSVARAWATLASALATPASPRAAAASAAASSLAEGTCPPLRWNTSRSRASVSRASTAPARACASAACVAASAAREPVTWSRSRASSSATSTWPFFTRSLTST